MAVISYENVKDVSYDPYEEKYWDAGSLSRELNRSFEICHGCRLCFKYCASFPSLFSAIDGQADGDVTKLEESDRRKVVGECFQCKICYVKCPYTDRDNHAYNLNFPALLQRAVHVRARENGVELRDKILQNAELAGRMSGGILAGVTNRLMKLGVFRALAQAFLGIHRKKIMPEFHPVTFLKAFRKRSNSSAAPEGQKVVLFATCFVNYNNPELGEAAVTVLEKNGCSVECPSQNCCGMPGLNSGDLEWAVKKMKTNVDSLYPHAIEGKKILAINPTCSMTMKKEYVTFLPPGEWREKAAVVSAAVMDVHEFLFELKKMEKFSRDFKSSPGEVALHVPCHLRAQNIGYRSRDIMRLIPGSSIKLVEECSGHNGSWAMKEEYFALSLEAGKRAFDEIKEHKDHKISTDCPLAAIQIQQGTGLKSRPVHPLQILARAYRSPEDGGFEKGAVSE